MFSRAWRRLHVFASNSDWCAVHMCRNWSEQLLWFWFYDPQMIRLSLLIIIIYFLVNHFLAFFVFWFQSQSTSGVVFGFMSLMQYLSNGAVISTIQNLFPQGR